MNSYEEDLLGSVREKGEPLLVIKDKSGSILGYHILEQKRREFIKQMTVMDEDLIKSQSPDHKGGRKFDGDKLQYGLLPPIALKDVVQVLTFGAQKYEPGNWRRVPDGHRRYFDAAQRHLWAYKEGEMFDPESGVNHLAHAICCLMFMNDLDPRPK